MEIKQLTQQNRRHWVCTAIAEANADLGGEARQRKYSAMAESPYRFFRGTSHLFWADLYKDWRFTFYGGTAGTQTWIQGDAHVYNFGAFANHDGEVIYGLDDFDDAIVSDYQYDLWRLGVSLVLDARENGHHDEATIETALRRMAKRYLKVATAFDPERADEVVHFTADTAPAPLAGFLEKVGSRKTRAKMLGKWTREQRNGRRTFDFDNPKLKRLSPQQRKAFTAAFEAYRQTQQDPVADARDPGFFAVKDIARRVRAGTGSLGTPRYYVLIEGAGSDDHDDIILDVKRQDGPAACGAMSADERAIYHGVFAHEGQRHALGFHALAEHPDRYLGWLALDDGVYSVRERSPFKKDFPSDSLGGGKRFVKMAGIWGEVLATEHRRAGRALNADAPFTFERSLQDATDGDATGFKRLFTAISRHYADCVTSDYDRFLTTLA